MGLGDSPPPHCLATSERPGHTGVLFFRASFAVQIGKAISDYSLTRKVTRGVGKPKKQ